MIIYYDSKTGNVERFITKVNAITNWKCIKITPYTLVADFGHLVTYTTKIGSVPDSTTAFMEDNKDYVLSISSSGNMNWGDNFARSADKISQKYNVPILIKFELSGLARDVSSFIQKVKDHANKKMDTPQQ